MDTTIIKIGRHEYKITDSDRFMDNGSCVQLLSQSKEKAHYGSRPSPVLSKKAVKEIEKFKRIQLEHDYKNKNVSVFKLDIKET